MRTNTQEEKLSRCSTLSSWQHVFTMMSAVNDTVLTQIRKYRLFVKSCLLHLKITPIFTKQCISLDQKTFCHQHNSFLPLFTSSFFLLR